MAQIVVACAFVGLSCFCLTGVLAKWLGRVVERFETSIHGVLAEMFVSDITPRRVTLIVAIFLAFCLVVFSVVLPGILGILLGTIIGLLLPVFVIYQKVKRRRSKLETQLLDALITLANGMRAGLNLGQAMALIENHSEKPMSQEFGLVNREIEHGTGIDVALDNAGRRLRSHNFRLLFAAMKTTRIRGGNMPETLDRLGESLREIVRLEEKIKAQTSQGRTSALFMGVMPAVVLGVYYLIDAEGVGMLFSKGMGQLILAVVVLLNIWGFLWIRRVVSFEI